MAKCSFCKKDMLSVDECSANIEIEFPDGRKLESIELTEQDPCHDCNIRIGKKHHPGCDMEKCPNCKGQLISCDCLVNLSDFQIN